MLQKFLSYINLKTDVDNFEEIHNSIERDVVFKGTNLWILVFAIIVASVGLNMNSTAVVIGAMLISPLMGPINGIGYSIATYNFTMLRKAVKSFTFAIGASLLASTVYFALSPISTAHSELLARTSPTIYDVLIAFFGGLSGIVAISSKKKGNVIPGVAIATALMPPLCTGGYGIATGQFTYVFGALYLFTINAVFIAISSLLVSQLLGFPIRGEISQKQKARINRILSIVIFVTVVPSIYFGYVLVQDDKFTVNADNYATNVSVFEGKFLLKHTINVNERQITLIYGGLPLTQDQKDAIKEKADNFGLKGSSITIKQGLSITDNTDKENREITVLKEEVARQTEILKIQKAKLDSINEWPKISQQLYSEAYSLYPYVKNCMYSESPIVNDSTKSITIYKIIVFEVIENKFDKKDITNIRAWLQHRLNSKDVKLYFDYKKTTPNVVNMFEGFIN